MFPEVSEDLKSKSQISTLEHGSLNSCVFSLVRPCFSFTVFWFAYALVFIFYSEVKFSSVPQICFQLSKFVYFIGNICPCFNVTLSFHKAVK